MGIDGILGTRATLMLDIVVLGMAVVVPALMTSVFLVRVKKQFKLHSQLQMGMALVLLVVLVLFELEMRLMGWRDRAEASPFFRAGGDWNDWVEYSLLIHLSFAIPTLFVWIYVVALAMRRFPKPPRPADHSASHRFWGWIAVYGMTLTAVTGWIFYVLAFVL